MKKFTLALTFSLSFCLVVQAGPEPVVSRDKTVMDISPACEFYRAHEWDFSFWGTYVFSGNPGRNNIPNDDPFSPDLDPEILVSSFFSSTAVEEPQELNPDAIVDVGRLSHDTFLGRDDSWGGGVDVKYFWSKYFGAGLEGFVVDTVAGTGGSGLVTFTARYPLGRFAPYGWAGAGFLAGGGRVDLVFNKIHTFEGGFVETDREFFEAETIDNKHVYFNGQLGVGMEYRLACHLGLMVDFAWNFIAGQSDPDKHREFILPGGECFSCNPGGPPITFEERVAQGIIPGETDDNKDFGMVRFGLTISY